MKNLLWVLVILGITFYLFGITLTTAVTSHLSKPDDWTDSANQPLQEYFGTVDRSILVLFMSMSGGQDWTEYYSVLTSMNLTYRVLFLLFIVFTLFAIVNIVTGVFVEAALQSNLKDRDIIAHEELQNKRLYLESMQDIFEEMDYDDQGTITIDEFEDKLQDERVIAYFNALKLDVSDARVLFKLLDIDESGEIDIDEFIVGCYKLQGESRSLDLKIMQYEVSALSDTTHEMHEMLREIEDKICSPEIRAKHQKQEPRKSFHPSAGEEHASWKKILGLDVPLDEHINRQARRDSIAKNGFRDSVSASSFMAKVRSMNGSDLKKAGASVSIGTTLSNSD
jgi:Ca2+-binding EF-hand superfamily protein